QAEQSAIAAIVRHLAAGTSVVVHTSRGPDDPRLQLLPANSAEIAQSLGRVVRAAIEERGLERLLVAGGDTSGHVAQALGIESLEMLAPLAPGAPLCQARAPSLPEGQLEVVFKGGQ